MASDGTPHPPAPMTTNTEQFSQREQVSDVSTVLTDIILDFYSPNTTPIVSRLGYIYIKESLTVFDSTRDREPIPN